jgi:hypothetical protein
LINSGFLSDLLDILTKGGANMSRMLNIRGFAGFREFPKKDKWGTGV